MADSSRTDASDSGVTTELTVREHLPGLEPERQITDWGRSERVDRLLDSTLSHFLYHYWLRVDVEGVENVPAQTGALLVANRAGQVRIDAAMVGKALREEHRTPRPLHVAAPPSVSDMPGLGMLATKLGAVTEHPANLHRLLHDERQLVLVFPESRHERVKPLSARYRLRSFDRVEIIRLAIQAGVPIVPVAVLGSEEATPALSSWGPLGRLTPKLGIRVPLPARFRLRFLQPVRTDRLGSDGELPPWSELSELTQELRALIQENLYEMVAARRSVWLG